MPQTAEILIPHIVIVFSNDFTYVVPSDDLNREFLVSAQIGDTIFLYIPGDRVYNGTITAKGLTQQNFPNQAIYWTIAFMVQIASAPAYMEKLLKYPV